MNKLRPVKNLENVLYDYFQLWILTWAEKYPGPKNRCIQKDFISSYVTSKLKQEIITRALKTHKYSLPSSSKCKILEILCDENTLSIDYSTSGTIFVEELFEFYQTFIKYIPKNLTRFGVSCLTKTLGEKGCLRDVNALFSRPLSFLKNLTSITLIGCGDEQVLKQLGLNCLGLEYVDVSKSQLVDDVALYPLLFCTKYIYDNEKNISEALECCGLENVCTRNIKFLGLTETEVTSTSIALALSHCPNIESFGGFINEGSVLEAMHALQAKDVFIEFKLKSLHEFRIEKWQVLDMLDMCPKMTELSTNGKSLPVLGDVQCLTSLFVDCDFQCYEDEVFDHLELCGTNLFKLVLTDSVNSKLDLNFLLQWTPNLKHLEAKLYSNEKDNSLVWKNLLYAKVILNSLKCFEALLSALPKVKKLFLSFELDPYSETEDDINNDFIEQILSKDSLPEVEHLSIASSGLDLSVMHSILSHCPNIKTISNLQKWHHKSSFWFDEFQLGLKEMNINIETFYYEHE